MKMKSNIHLFHLLRLDYLMKFKNLENHPPYRTLKTDLRDNHYRQVVGMMAMASDKTFLNNKVGHHSTLPSFENDLRFSKVTEPP